MFFLNHTHTHTHTNLVHDEQTKEQLRHHHQNTYIHQAFIAQRPQPPLVSPICCCLIAIYNSKFIEIYLNLTNGPLMLHYDVEHKILHTKTVIRVIYELWTHQRYPKHTSAEVGPCASHTVQYFITTAKAKRLYSRRAFQF